MGVTVMEPVSRETVTDWTPGALLRASYKAGDCMFLPTHERYTTNTCGRHTNTWREKKKKKHKLDSPYTYLPGAPNPDTSGNVSWLPQLSNFQPHCDLSSPVDIFFSNFPSMPDFAKSFTQVNRVVWNWSWGFWLSSFSFWKAYLKVTFFLSSSLRLHLPTVTLVQSCLFP